MIDTNGAVKLCCVAEDPTKKDHGKDMDVQRSNLSTLWNSVYMQNVRERLLEGKQVKDCGQCYRKERRGEYSFRQRANKDWPEQVQKVMLNPTTVVEDMPKNLSGERPWGPGDNPKTAVWEYLKTHTEFEIDKSIQNKLLITVAPDGYLKRIR